MDFASFVRRLDAYPKTLEDFRVRTYAGAMIVGAPMWFTRLLNHDTALCSMWSFFVFSFFFFFFFCFFADVDPRRRLTT